MNWKNWPYWLRWGLIIDVGFLILYGLFVILLLFLIKIGLGAYAVVFGGLINLLLLLPGIFIGKSNFIFVISVVFYFIVGAIIGWIVSKIKNRKQSVSQSFT